MRFVFECETYIFRHCTSLQLCAFRADWGAELSVTARRAPTLTPRKSQREVSFFSTNKIIFFVITLIKVDGRTLNFVKQPQWHHFLPKEIVVCNMINLFCNTKLSTLFICACNHYYVVFIIFVQSQLIVNHLGPLNSNLIVAHCLLRHYYIKLNSYQSIMVNQGGCMIAIT